MQQAITWADNTLKMLLWKKIVIIYIYYFVN